MRGLIVDMLGQKWGRLFVVSYEGIHNHKATWRCLCDCGAETIVEGKKLRRGHTRSCGCLKREVSAARQFKHGHTYVLGNKRLSMNVYTREYRAWMNLKQRVLNPNSEDYNNYGARGITICERWLNSFSDFYVDMGPCPEGLEIDRINVNGNYEPSNCRWTTELIQARNRRPFIAAHGLEAVHG